MSRAAIDPAHLRAIVARFQTIGPAVEAGPLTLGHINDSFVVCCLSGGTLVRYVLQRINAAVFHDPLAVMDNIARVTEHIAARLAAAGATDIRRRCLTLIRTHDNRACHDEGAGHVWRMYEYIERTRSVESVRSPDDARAAGRAFGAFSAHLADFPAPPLRETIPRFHDTPLRIAQLDAAIAADRAGRAGGARAEIAAIREQRCLAPLLLNLLARSAIPQRIAHNDAKISNILFDEVSGEALCVVDLDTVMPGLSLFDFGDMVRSMTCRAAEDEPDASRVRFDRRLYEALRDGYLEYAGAFLNQAELDHLLDAGRVIIYEQAVRFMTDYLNGDIYYQTSRPDQNLTRARVQLALLRSIGQ